MNLKDSRERTTTPPTTTTRRSRISTRPRRIPHLTLLLAFGSIFVAIVLANPIAAVSTAGHGLARPTGAAPPAVINTAPNAYGVVRTPPYRSADSKTFEAGRTGGCGGNFNFTSRPNASKLTGTVHFGEHAGVSTYKCKPSFKNMASVEMYGGLLGPAFRPSSSGNRTISFAWHLSAAATSWTWGANASVELLGNLYDNSSHAWVLNGSVVTILGGIRCGVICSAFGAFSYPSSSLTASMNATSWVNFSAPVSANHTYQFYTVVAGYASIFACHTARGGYLVCGGGGIDLDLFSSGHGASILSMRAF